MFVRLLLTAAAISLIWVSSASAAPGPIDPTELDRSEAIGEVTVGTDPFGGSAIAVEGPDILRALGRSNLGAYGPAQELSRTGNVEPPPRIVFDSSGRGFAAWGIATSGTDAQWARRAPGGLFGAVDEVNLCRRFLDYDMAPDGTILLACRANGGTAPNDDVVRYATVDPTDPTITAAGIASGAGIDDNFIHPLASLGDDGTAAIGWYEEDATTGTTKVEVLVRPAGAAVFEPLETLVEATTSDFDELADLEVLPDGTTLALVARYPGLELYTRPPGTETAWSKTQTPLSDLATGQLAVDAAGRAILGAAHAASEGPGIPVTISTATRPPGGAFGPLATLAAAPNLRLVRVDATPSGTALVSWGEFEGAERLFGALAAPGAAFGAPVTIASGVDASDVALDPAGNALAAWSTIAGPGDQRLFAGGIDSGAPPTFGAVQVPAATVAGTATRLSASASDWSGIRAIQWTLPGGVVLSGAEVSHVFPTAGDFTVQVTAIDRAGNPSTSTSAIRVVDPNASPPAALDTRKPRLGLRTRGRLKLRAFLRRGVRARINVDERSRVEFELLARAKGARISARDNLILASRTLKSASGKRVVRLRPQRRLIGKARKFKVRLRVTAIDSSGNRRVGQRTIRVR